MRPVDVVGIGASAGGLEALEVLLSSLSSELEVAWVVVQHLAPDRESLLAQLLTRATELSVRSVEDDMPLSPGALFLIPPNTEMILANGKLWLTEREPNAALARPIDQFFRSLSTECGSRAIAVVLSGTGNDGALGVVDIHGAGGLVIVQTPESAKFDSMPSAAIETGVVDHVLVPSEMADAIERRIASTAARERDEARGAAFNDQPTETLPELDRVFECLRADFDVDFNQYRTTTVQRRLERRALLSGVDTLDAYVQRLRGDPSERHALHRDLLVGVTRFFRDPAAFALLETSLIPELVETSLTRGSLRLWVAGCATGEEAYSLAMLVHEALGRSPKALDVKLFATDLHRESLQIASAGEYPEESVRNLSDARRERYFRRQEGRWRVTPQLRQMITFARHDLLRDAPFRQLDLISCRNLLIYLRPSAQKKVLSLFHFGMRTGGLLLLGPSESPGSLQPEFDELDRRWRIYKKRRDVRVAIEPQQLGLTDTRALVQGAQLANGGARAERQIIELYDELLRQHMPPSFLVDESFQVLHTFGGAERLLRLRGGRPTTKLVELLADDLKTAVTGALHHASRGRREVRYSGLRARGDDGTEEFHLFVQPLEDARTHSLRYLVRLDSLGPAKAGDTHVEEQVLVGGVAPDHLRALEGELRLVRENLQTTIEELETSNEELQSANEELVASNQELQSTNAELQSVNEELHTINGEHQRQILELTLLTDDMNNLLASTRVGVIFLDGELCIRRFTPEIGRLFHLVPEDVGGRIDSFAHGLEYPELLDDLKRVCATRVPIDREVRDAEGAPFLARIQPYESNTAVQGVVLTLGDVRVLREAQDDLALFKFLSLNAVDVQVLLNQESQVEYVNSAAARLLGRSAKWLEKRAWRELIDVDLAGLIESACSQQAHMEEVVIEDPARGPRTAEISAKSVQFRGKKYCFVSLRDVTSRKVSERRLLVEHAVAAALGDAPTLAQGLARTLEEFVAGFDLFVAEAWTTQGEKIVLEQQRYGPRATQSERWRRVSRDSRSRRGIGLVGRVWDGLQPIWIDDLRELHDLVRYDEATGLGLRTAFGFPVVDDGVCIAVLAFFSRTPIESDEGLSNVVASVRRGLEQFVRRVRIERTLWLRNRAIEAAREGLLIVDAEAEDAPIVYVNSGFELMTGYARAEAIGRNCRFLQGEGTDPAARAELRDALATRRECRVTLINYTKDGRPFWNDLEIAPLRDERGEVTHFVGMQHDVSALKGIEQELRQAHVLAQAASAAKSEFLANVSHEIRTPLSTILGFCDILLERTRERETVEDLRAIRRNGAYLAELIEDILDLSRIEAGRLRIQRQTFALAELVLDLDSLMQVRARERALQLSFEFTTDVPLSMQSDRVRVRQILVNLIGNALKFTERGQVRVLMSLASEPGAARLEFAVVDTGPGIEPADFERIFEPFTQARSTAERHGAGLGLTISRRLAGELGGTISVASELGLGSRFSLSLPIETLEGVTVSRPDLRAFALGSREARVEGAFVGCRALVVDDIADVRRVVTHFLGQGGALVEAATTGAEALAKYERAVVNGQPFDVVLVDIGLPDMRGDQVIAELRRRGCERPILAVTASAMKDERERWLDAGCDEVIAKPVDGVALVRAVAGHLARRARFRRFLDGKSPADAGVPLSVLLVEDDVDSAESTRRLLESRGASVHVAHSGREALDQYRTNVPELVLLDLRLGDIDGFALAENLLAQTREPRPLFAAVSGLSDSEDESRAHAAGFELLLVKPVDPELLFGLLEQARERRSKT